MSASKRKSETNEDEPNKRQKTEELAVPQLPFTLISRQKRVYDLLIVELSFIVKELIDLLCRYVEPLDVTAMDQVSVIHPIRGMYMYDSRIHVIHGQIPSPSERISINVDDPDDVKRSQSHKSFDMNTLRTVAELPGRVLLSTAFSGFHGSENPHFQLIWVDEKMKYDTNIPLVNGRIYKSRFHNYMFCVEDAKTTGIFDTKSQIYRHRVLRLKGSGVPDPVGFIVSEWYHPYDVLPVGDSTVIVAYTTGLVVQLKRSLRQADLDWDMIYNRREHGPQQPFKDAAVFIRELDQCFFAVFTCYKGNRGYVVIYKKGDTRIDTEHEFGYGVPNQRNWQFPGNHFYQNIAIANDKHAYMITHDPDFGTDLLMRLSF